MTHARATALTGSNQAVLTSIGVYRGITLRETAGAVATVRVWDNASAASGTIVETVRLAANGSFSALDPMGIWVSRGLFVEIVAGAVEGSVRIG